MADLLSGTTALRSVRAVGARGAEVLRLLAKNIGSAAQITNSPSWPHRNEARAMLSEIFAWFTEGFDTADLKDAKALFEQLTA